MQRELLQHRAHLFGERRAGLGHGRAHSLDRRRNQAVVAGTPHWARTVWRCHCRLPTWCWHGRSEQLLQLIGVLERCAVKRRPVLEHEPEAAGGHQGTKLARLRS